MSSQILKTRKKILQATLKLLTANEGKGVRISDIAKKAGITRQGLYLHFENRADLLIAATKFFDEQKDISSRLAPSRNASSGRARLTAYIEAWCNYIPEMYGTAKALLILSERDEAAETAWQQRMQDMREGCEAAILALDRDGQLSPFLPVEAATDLLWTLLSIRNWEHLVQDCGWSQESYVATILTSAHQLFIHAKNR